MSNLDMNSPNANNAGDANAPDIHGLGGAKDNRSDLSARSPSAEPNSTATQTAGERLEVELLPSQKEVARQAASRRDASLGAVINLGLKEVADAGGPVPSPTIHEDLLRLSARMQKISQDPQGHFQLVELCLFHTRLLSHGRKVRTRRRKRKKLWSKAADETSAVTIQARLDGRESARLHERSRQAKTPPPVLLRRGLLRALRRQGEMKKLESWIGRWASRAEHLSEKSASNDSVSSGSVPGGSVPGGNAFDDRPWIWESAMEVAEEIDRVLRDRLPC